MISIHLKNPIPHRINHHAQARLKIAKRRPSQGFGITVSEIWRLMKAPAACYGQHPISKIQIRVLFHESPGQFSRELFPYCSKASSLEMGPQKR